MSVVVQFMLSALVAFAPSGQFDESGKASYYGEGKWHGDITANGEVFDPGSRTCAHRRLDFGEWVVVRNEGTGLVSFCRINDRGPYDIINGEPLVDNSSNYERFIDVSVRVAKDLEMRKSGLVRASIITVGS